MYEDTPQELVHDLFSEAVFGPHALGRPVIGTADVISTVSRRAVAAYHRSMYTGGNIVVSAAGNITHEKLVSLLQRAERGTDAARRGPHVRRPLVRTPPPGLRFQRKDTEQYHLCLGATGIARSDRRRFAASLLDSILGGSASSRLFQEIREKRGMAYAVYSFASQYTDTGLIGIYVGTREENLAACVEICCEQIAEIAAGKLPQGRARARAGEPEGAHHAVHGVDVEPDEPARQVAHRRHGAADAGADHRRDRRGRRGGAGGARVDAARAGAAVRVRCRSGRGPVQERRRARQRGARHARRRHESRALRRRREGGEHARPGAGAGGPRGARHRDRRRDRRRGLDAAVDFTTPDAAPANVRAALEQGVSCVVGTTGFELALLGELAKERGLALFHRAELLHRRGADDALLRRGRAVHAARGDHRAAQRGEEGRAVGNGQGDGRADRRRPGDPLGAPAGARRAPGGDLRRRGPDADHPPRHVVARGVRPRGAARARAAPVASARPDRGPRDLPVAA